MPILLSQNEIIKEKKNKEKNYIWADGWKEEVETWDQFCCESGFTQRFQEARKISDKLSAGF